VTTAVLAMAAAYGVHLLYSAVALGWDGLGPGPSIGPSRARERLRTGWTEVGLDAVRLGDLVGAAVVLALVGAALGYALFGGALAPAAGALFAASFPVTAARARRRRRLDTAREAWPRLLEELRIQTTALGRSVPQALFEVGTTAPPELRGAFDAARREWLLSTDFERALAVLKARLADPTADAVGETLLVAHALGGTQVDRCLAALVDDRVLDLQSRKDADARQAGARFARRFVLVVPLGMAALGLGVGEGRAAYGTATGQVLVVVGLALLAGCWWWSGRLMRLPAEERVFP
jgi:tight adherence protein B